MRDDRADRHRHEHRQRDRCRKAMDDAELELAARDGERRREGPDEGSDAQPGAGRRPGERLG